MRKKLLRKTVEMLFGGAKHDASSSDGEKSHNAAQISGEAYAALTELFNGIVIEIDLKAHKILERHNFSQDIDVHISGSNFISDMIVQGQVHFEDKVALGAFSDKLYSAVPSDSVYARIKNTAGEFVWYRFTAKHVPAQDDKPARVICSIINTDREKRNTEEQREAARRYRSVLAASCDTILEIDLTEDRIIAQDDVWHRQLGIDSIPTFSHYIENEALISVFPEDSAAFKNAFSPDALLAAYKRGKTSVSLEYRIQTGDKVEWHNCTMCILEDKFSSHLSAVAYIKDVTEKKLKELEVVTLAERDSLTRLYNKRTVQIFIEDFLENEGQTGQHALFIIDLDNFKSINDNFGHPFGDAVLNEIAERLSIIFRTSDIIGRIGGDEFLVFAKNIQIETIHQKARQLVERLRNTYTANHTAYTVSGSVGICRYPDDGATYAQLYENADTALYSVKKEGKNSYGLFNSGMLASAGLGGALVRENDFNNEHMARQKSFNENLSDYIFKILYESKNIDEGISLVLALIGKRYKADRAYIFLDSEDGLFCSNTHEWCADGIIPQLDDLQNVPYAKLGGYTLNFNIRGIFYCRDIKILHPDAHDILQQQGVQSLVQCAIMESGAFKGFIGFDYCKEKIADDQDRIETLLTVSRMLGVFLLKARMQLEVDCSAAIQSALLHNFNTSMYLVDSSGMQVLYADKKLARRIQRFPAHTPCHKIFYGFADQCPQCPLRTITEKKKKNRTELYDSAKKEHIMLTAQKITWIGAENAYLLCRTPVGSPEKNSAVF